jgi:hypothetical protein
LWNYGYTTIPRHLRDIYVTEYGSADLRGKSDEDCTIAMLALCDARFIDALAARAKSDGKLRKDFSVPDRWRENTPERLQDALRPIRSSLPQFPFGSDFTPDEQALLPALQRLQTVTATKPALAAFLLSTLWKGRPTPEMTPLLRRLGLDVPKNIGERLLRRLVSTALRASGRGV